jgi:hypothetical protein
LGARATSHAVPAVSPKLTCDFVPGLLSVTPSL